MTPRTQALTEARRYARAAQALRRRIKHDPPAEAVTLRDAVEVAILLETESDFLLAMADSWAEGPGSCPEGGAS